MDISTIREGDRLSWRGKSGEQFATVGRIATGELVAFTDETHCFSLSSIAGSKSLRIVERAKRPAQKVTQTYTIDNAPVLF